jgi:hypothetical protein
MVLTCQMAVILHIGCSVLQIVDYVVRLMSSYHRYCLTSMWYGLLTGKQLYIQDTRRLGRLDWVALWVKISLDPRLMLLIKTCSHEKDNYGNQSIQLPLMPVYLPLCNCESRSKVSFHCVTSVLLL